MATTTSAGAGSGESGATTTTANTTSAGTTDTATLQTVADLLSTMFAQNVSIPTSTPTEDVTVTPTASTSSTSPIIYIVILGGIGFAVWYFVRHKKSGGE